MLAELVGVAAALVGSWETGPPLPVARMEVAGAVVRGEIYVVGGYLANGQSSARVDVYSASTRRWRRGPDLPVAVNHSMAAGYRGRLYVVGGVRRPGELARVSYALDLRRNRWASLPGPTPREHLAVAALGGRVYAVAGRLGGIDTNQATVESLAVGTRRWTSVAPVPEARGGTGAAAAAGRLVSVGGESPAGTTATVFAFTAGTRRWERLPDLPTARHGLAVVGIGSRVYVIAGGPRPGLFVSGANESLDLRG
jgi:N-acetylneuraminic acid mutarotase